MFYDVLIYLEPTTEEAEQGKKEEMLFYSGDKPIRGDKDETVGFLAVADLLKDRPELKDSADRIKVKLRPFG